jgi:hypothetical protein
LYLYKADINTDSALSESLVTLLKSTVIPQIERLRNFELLRSALKFDIFSPLLDGSPTVRVDFFDVAASDALCDGFQTK